MHKLKLKKAIRKQQRIKDKINKRRDKLLKNKKKNRDSRYNKQMTEH